jgi:hypothetical protein
MSSPEYAEEQAMELEALKAILADDLQGVLQSQLAVLSGSSLAYVMCAPASSFHALVVLVP